MQIKHLFLTGTVVAVAFGLRCVFGMPPSALGNGDRVIPVQLSSLQNVQYLARVRRSSELNLRTCLHRYRCLSNRRSWDSEQGWFFNISPLLLATAIPFSWDAIAKLPHLSQVAALQANIVSMLDLPDWPD